MSLKHTESVRVLIATASDSSEYCAARAYIGRGSIAAAWIMSIKSSECGVTNACRLYPSA